MQEPRASHIRPIFGKYYGDPLRLYTNPPDDIAASYVEQL